MSSLETLELMEHTFPDVGDVNSIWTLKALFIMSIYTSRDLMHWHWWP